jgi:serine/threonine protein kinase
MPFLCPTCDARYETDLGTCPKDGDHLVPFKDPDGLVGKVIDGRFEVKRLLGRGGMGSVYLAHQRSVDRLVALKVMKADLLEDQAQVKRFILEARAASRLTNNHTITIYDFGKSADGVPYIAMEYLRGLSLRDHLKQEGSLPVDEVVRITSEIAESLAEAHEHGIVHRDLKPENVFLATTGGREGVVKVLDFGIARARSLQGGSAVTSTGVIMGTPSYMSPEMIVGEPVDARADLYALGIMMYEMLTGLVPYQAETPMQVLLKHLHSEPEALERVIPSARVPGALQRFVWRCLSKSRDARPEDAKAFLAELTAAAAASGDDQLMFPVYATSTGFRVDADSLELLTTKKQLLQPLKTGSTGGSGTGTPAYVSDIVVENKTSALPWVIVASGAVLALAVALFFLVRPTLREPAAPLPAPAPAAAQAASPAPVAAPAPVAPAPVAPAPVAPETVSLSLVSVPPGAAVRLDGTAVGVTPHVLRVPKGPGVRRVELTLAGHEPATVPVVPDQDRIVQQVLTPMAPAPAPTVEKAPEPAPAAVKRPEPAPRRPKAAPAKPAKPAGKAVDERAGDWM